MITHNKSQQHMQKVAFPGSSFINYTIHNAQQRRVIRKPKKAIH
jgi:hypothetical protein